MKLELLELIPQHCYFLKLSKNSNVKSDLKSIPLKSLRNIASYYRYVVALFSLGIYVPKIY